MFRPSLSRSLPASKLPLRSGLRRKWSATQIQQASRRNATTGATTGASISATKAKNFLVGTVLSAGAVLGYYYLTDTRANVHRWLVVPMLRSIYPDAEEAHLFGNKALRGLYAFGLHPRERGDPDAAGDLEVEVYGSLILLQHGR
jgi:dihydroorotate dehydrogenase